MILWFYENISFQCRVNWYRRIRWRLFTYSSPPLPLLLQWYLLDIKPQHLLWTHGKGRRHLPLSLPLTSAALSYSSSFSSPILVVPGSYSCRPWALGFPPCWRQSCHCLCSCGNVPGNPEVGRAPRTQGKKGPQWKPPFLLQLCNSSYNLDSLWNNLVKRKKKKASL